MLVATVRGGRGRAPASHRTPLAQGGESAGRRPLPHAQALRGSVPAGGRKAWRRLPGCDKPQSRARAPCGPGTEFRTAGGRHPPARRENPDNYAEARKDNPKTPFSRTLSK